MNPIIFFAEARIENGKVKVQVKDSEIEMDPLGGDNPSPEEYFLASALACYLLTVNYIAKEKGVEIRELKGYIEGEMNLEGFYGKDGIPPGFLSIKMEVEISPNDKLQEIIEESNKRCPLKHTIENGVKIKISIK
ncbi:MAG: OsmC family protein [Sulfolobaceae archaeon]